eukprot:1724626-Rhodomonas_salina.4
MSGLTRPGRPRPEDVAPVSLTSGQRLCRRDLQTRSHVLHAQASEEVLEGLACVVQRDGASGMGSVRGWLARRQNKGNEGGNGSGG